MPNQKTKASKIIEVTSRRTSCDGGAQKNNSTLGHPKVYMDMGQSNSVRCKYCDKTFVLKGH
ncbi:MAG: zinc-finger domain-containing protein [Robiginitomaculum sp.]